MISADQEGAIIHVRGSIEVLDFEQIGERRLDTYDAPTGDRVAAVQSRPSQPQKRTRKPANPQGPIATPTVESRAAFRSNWRGAQEAAEAMVRAAETGDQMGLGIAADDLDQRLGKLWDLREGRDLDWQTILNHAQGMMRVFFQEQKAECLSAEQCESIATIVRDYLGPATKSVDDLNEVLRLLDDAGFDPYAAISADPLDEVRE